MPGISVVITTYNGEKYIEEQLRSVLDQTQKPDEVIIFDDCSTDRTVDIVKGFINKNASCWSLSINQNNIGFIKNFHQAIGAAKGEYVFLCDQDDVWHRDKIEKMMLVFNSHKDVIALNTGFRPIGMDGSPLETSSLGVSYNKLLNSTVKEGSIKKIDIGHIIRKNISPGCTAAYKRDCILFYLENASMRWPHDWELNIFAAMMDGLYFYGEKLVDYRIHTGNAIGFNIEKPISADTRYARIGLAKKERDRTSLYNSRQCRALMNAKCAKSFFAYHGFVCSRYKALRNKSFFGWIKTLTHVILYIEAVGLKGMVGDLIFVIRGRA
ncbi:MAG: glycosyltransferase [Burkholderiales bacterium]